MVLDQQEQSEKLIEEFGRQILVPGISEEGQLNISKKKICIIGLGALGTVVFLLEVVCMFGLVEEVIKFFLKNNYFWFLFKHIYLPFPR